MEGIIDNYHGPWGVGARGKLVLANQVHPLAHQIGAVLNKVNDGQERKRYPAPAGKKHDTNCPDPAVQQASQ